MKTIQKQHRQLFLIVLLYSLWMSFTAYGSQINGEVTSINETGISGFAWIPSLPSEAVNIEIYIYNEGESNPFKVVATTADQPIDGKNRGFNLSINWAEFSGKTFFIEAYASFDGLREKLLGETTYIVQNDETTPSLHLEALGTFTTTAYCSCKKCSGTNTHTYAGTTPKAGHTISADLDVFPIGTKLQINGVTYTVEDTGSAINGRKLDIYYATHQEALNHGKKQQEVFLVHQS